MDVRVGDILDEETDPLHALRKAAGELGVELFRGLDRTDNPGYVEPLQPDLGVQEEWVDDGYTEVCHVNFKDGSELRLIGTGRDAAWFGGLENVDLLDRGMGEEDPQFTVAGVQGTARLVRVSGDYPELLSCDLTVAVNGAQEIDFGVDRDDFHSTVGDVWSYLEADGAFVEMPYNSGHIYELCEGILTLSDQDSCAGDLGTPGPKPAHVPFHGSF